ncbi:MAG: hypothetical protein HY564_01570 [Candidatus Jacksonbacteria bacterium]|nr:hypothetical protein [Candidatus Jacksonbacteria bacterium]
MILYIDTTHELKLEVALYTCKGEKQSELVIDEERDRSGRLLKAVDHLLKNSKKEMIAGIVAVKGPHGRFSMIRLGVVSANALGFCWNLPVIGILQGEDIAPAIEKISNRSAFYEPIIPVYDKEPNIT